MSLPVLSTKLYIPEIHGNRVIRDSLVEKVAKGIKSGGKLTLVSAPAGYGKTTLVLEVLESIKMKHAWISLDEGDNDLPQFLAYFVAALKKCGLAIGSDTEELISDFNLSASHAAITLLINDIAASSEKVVFVLDDFHLINSPQVYDCVKFLLEHQPINFHMVISTREDPRLPLAHLRVQRKMTEIRMEDLSFGSSETEEFLKEVMGLEVNESVVKSVASRTEGWAAGLQLAGILLGSCDRQGMEDFAKEFNDTHKYIIDYLVEEVINRQPDEIKDFLCKTSVLERMNGDICDKLTGISGCKQRLYDLEASNLFIIHLDSRGEWYRYHHLFADSLRAQLAREDEMELQRRAALWFSDNGLKQEAVRHAIKSGDNLLAIKLIEDNTEQAFRNAQLATLLKWMNSIPENMIRENEILSVRKAWVLFLTGNTSGAMQYLDSLGEDFIERTTPHNRGLFFSLRALRAKQMGQENSEDLAREALEYLEPWDPIARISTMNTLGRCQLSRGAIEEADMTFRAAYNEGITLGYTFITTISLTYLCTNLNIMGRRMDAIELYLNYIEGMTKEFGKPLPFIGLVYIGLAGLYYDGNEIDKALEYIVKGIDMCTSISYNWTPYTWLIHAQILYAFGDEETAVKNLENYFRKALNENARESITSAAALLTELYIKSDNAEAACEYGIKLKDLIGGKDMGILCEEYISYARFLIYQGSDSEALKLLDNLEKEIVQRKRARELIKFYILYAGYYYRSRNFEKAEQYLINAVNIASPQGYCRLFLEDIELLKAFIGNSKKQSEQFLKRILEYIVLQKDPLKGEPLGTRLDKDLLGDIEKLSKREVEILELIGKGMSNNEIANKLYISINTTQWHISHIYSKLGVTSRTQAILKAHDLGIL